MKSDRCAIIPELNIVSVGVSYTLYFVLQYLLGPFLWWLAPYIDFPESLDDVLSQFNALGLTVATQQSIVYSLIGFASFGMGYRFFSEKALRIHNPIIHRGWDISKAERMFFGLFLGGFALKALKALMGEDVSRVVGITVVSNSYIAFFLSLNQLHLIGLAVINIAYQEARARNDRRKGRLCAFAYLVNVFYLMITLTTGNKTATIFPAFALLIIRQYYVPLRPTIMFTVVACFTTFVFTGKHVLRTFVAMGTSTDTSTNPLVYGFFYMLLHRVNMSAVLTSVIDFGRHAFPNGTLGQFWVDMMPYGMERVNVFDGNDFGRDLGLITKDDYVTGVAVTNMGDLFINFGLAGIILGMLLNGWLHKIFVSTCRTRRPLLVLLYALLWPILIHGMESPITVLYAAVIKTVFICLIVHYWIGFRSLGQIPKPGFTRKNITEGWASFRTGLR